MHELVQFASNILIRSKKKMFTGTTLTWLRGSGGVDHGVRWRGSRGHVAWLSGSRDVYIRKPHDVDQWVAVKKQKAFFGGSVVGTLLSLC